MDLDGAIKLFRERCGQNHDVAGHHRHTASIRGNGSHCGLRHRTGAGRGQAAVRLRAGHDSSLRPALLLFLGRSNPGIKLYSGLEAANFLHLWSAVALGIGLSKLARDSFNEAAFRVIGYWIGSRIALIALG